MAEIWEEAMDDFGLFDGLPEPDRAPELSGGDVRPGFLNSPYGARLDVESGNAPFTWDVAGGSLPPGIELVDGLLWGSPTATGTYTPTIRVTDVDGDTDEAVFEITVRALR